MKKLTVALVLLVGLGLVGASSEAEETPEALMQAGLETLYTKGDAEAAAATFRKVLEQNPSHYGATFQLAMALDRAGKSAEARPLGESSQDGRGLQRQGHRRDRSHAARDAGADARRGDDEGRPRR